MIGPRRGERVNNEEPLVTNVDEAEEIEHLEGRWGHAYTVLTPGMRERGGTLGVCRNRLPPGFAAAPFHWHLREDEVFFVLSGRGVLRYGDQLRVVRQGDCISCPAGTQVAHQFANPFDEDFVYLAMGPHDPHEVCGYPDSGKVMVRSLRQVGFLRATPYMEGEPELPRVFELIDERES